MKLSGGIYEPESSQRSLPNPRAAVKSPVLTTAFDREGLRVVDKTGDLENLGGAH
jgi:hypothetical protein